MEETVFKKDKRIMICSFISAALMLVLLVMQFQPFWTCTDCKNCEDDIASISAYIWFPEKHKPITKDMTQVYKDRYGEDLKDEKGKPYKFNANDIALYPVILLVFGAAGLVLCLIKPHMYIVSALPLISGAVGGWGYLTNPAMQAGRHWELHLATCVAVVIAALVPFALQIMKIVRRQKRQEITP